MKRWIVAAWIVLASVAAADTQRIPAVPGLIQLRIEPPAGADVSWEARQPADLGFLTFEAGAACVLCWHNPGTLVMVSDVIDWESRKRDKTTWIIDVGPVDPIPTPDPPGPTPDPPTPDSVVNKYGLGHPAYHVAKSINDPTNCKRLADVFHSTAIKLSEGRVTAAGADQIVRQFRESLPATWDAFDNAVEPAFSKAVATHGSGIVQYRDFFAEISKALAVAAGTQRIR